MIELIRPSQWLKNLFVFLPLFFGGEIMNLFLVKNAGITFIIYSLFASAIYVFNDLIDKDYDKLHPDKKFRPIASGKVSTKQAFFLIFILLSLATSLIFTLPLAVQKNVSFVLVSYLIINILYSLGLKNVAILDVFIIAAGFVLRLFAGGLTTENELSHWIVLMTFLLALMLGFAKRRDDVTLFLESGKKARKNTNTYNIAFLNQIISIVGTVTIVCYIMYSLSEEVTNRLKTDYLYLTSIFVLAGIIRYLQIAIVEKNSGNPTKILVKDRFIQTVLICWIISFYLIIY